MGGFYGSIHIRTEPYELIKKTLHDMAKKDGYKFYLAPAINGWISFFPDNYGQIPIASEIAKHFRFDILQLMVHDDDIFCYWYYRDGKLIDEYNSCPDYFGDEVTIRDIERLAGRPEVFMGLVNDPCKIDSIREILAESFGLSGEEMSPEIRKFNEISKKIANVAFDGDPEAAKKLLIEKAGFSEEELADFARRFENFQALPLEDQIDMGRTFWEKFYINFDDIFKTTRSYENSRNQEYEYQRSDAKVPGDILFASVSMDRFAEVLGIPNAVTSYEYLATGETDNIIGWDKFIEISV